MWVFAMFDLPVKTKKDRRLYTRFRNRLIAEGFSRLQFSVYARYFGSEESSQSCRRLIRDEIPPNGHVRLLMVTDKQFGKMENYDGKKPAKIEEQPEQLTLL
jgi:CRISPR-associated protein Cas2